MANSSGATASPGWVRRSASLCRSAPVSLILYPPPSITRSVVLAALGQAGVPWRIVCTSDSLSGIVATAAGGLGVAVLARRLIPAGLVEIGPGGPLPALGTLDFVLLRNPRVASALAGEIAAAIIAKGHEYGSPLAS